MDCECVVVGAGPAGLHCGIYLGRFNRRVIIFHGGKPRAEWIPVAHNFPGFLHGVTGVDLLRTLRSQAEHYGAEIRREIVRMIQGEDGRFTVKTPRAEFSTRKVILATGVKDIPPDVPNARHYVGRSIRHCPICDAFEARGRRMVVFGAGERAASQAVWLAHFTDDLTILTTGLHAEVSERLRGLLDLLGIRIIQQRVTAIEERNQRLGTVFFEDGGKLEDVFRGYSAMGLKPNSELAAGMGIELDSDGFIMTDERQETSVKGVFAAGDVVSGRLAQLSVAMGHAATAATYVHNSMLVI